jgi:hypothetical protein
MMAAPALVASARVSEATRRARSVFTTARPIEAEVPKKRGRRM